MNLTREKLVVGGVMLSIFLTTHSAKADQFHYNNVVVGERAQGMGGAYAAIADDASGVYYNPAGLAFAQSNDISGSANAYYSKKVTYKGVLGGEDWVETSQGSFAPFFGVMQKLDKVVPGLVGGFAMYTEDTELKDQNDLKLNVEGLSRYHRTANSRATTSNMTGAGGYRLSPKLGLGFGIGYINANELAQVFQNVVIDGSYYLASNQREHLVTYGIDLAFGVQYAISSEVTWGLTLRRGKYFSQKYERQTDALLVQKGAGTSNTPSELKSDNPLGSMPITARTGVAWFASPRLVMAGDVIYTTGVSDMDDDTYLNKQNKRAAEYFFISKSFVKSADRLARMVP